MNINGGGGRGGGPRSNGARGGVGKNGGLNRAVNGSGGGNGSVRDAGEDAAGWSNGSSAAVGSTYGTRACSAAWRAVVVNRRSVSLRDLRRRSPGHVGIPRDGRPLGGIIFQSAPLGFELLVLLVPGRGAAGHADGVAVAGLLPALPSVDGVVLLGIAVVTVLEDNFRSFGRRARSTAVGRGSVVLQQRTRALAAPGEVQTKAWHSNTRTPVVRLRMAAKTGGCFESGKLANGESSGRNC
ncbi:hypothetical protein T4E_4434 [Trichinella pseudospiralis]|uniref:Uncharacterized protein n=1 Tax=Trichinella pseudospiralis TaxID=6337 RepID=A0A0V0XZC0_TRIPS|nr:hypothetical protein T4E_4434 [Trichinella pseudospiralis]